MSDPSNPFAGATAQGTAPITPQGKTPGLSMHNGQLALQQLHDMFTNGLARVGGDITDPFSALLHAVQGSAPAPDVFPKSFTGKGGLDPSVPNPSKAAKGAAATPPPAAGTTAAEPQNPGLVNPQALQTLFTNVIQPFLSQQANSMNSQVGAFSSLEQQAAAQAPPDVKALLNAFIPQNQANLAAETTAITQGAESSGMWDLVSQQLAALTAAATKSGYDYLYGQAGGSDSLTSLLGGGSTTPSTTPAASGGTPATTPNTPAGEYSASQVAAILQSYMNGNQAGIGG